MKRLSKRAASLLLPLLLLCTALSYLTGIATANPQATSESLTLTVFLDGFVLVNYDLTLNQTYPAINVSLIGETHEELLAVDEQNLPIEYSIVNNEAIIYSLNATRITITYFTQDITSKIGKYWTLTAESPTNATLILPEAVTIISVNNVPELIQTADDQMVLVMPSGTIEITYIAEHEFGVPTQKLDPKLLIVAAIVLLVAGSIVAAVVWRSKRKKPLFAPAELKSEVDTKKILGKHKDLRQEEIQVISFLVEKHGTALEAELYEKLDLPRTTTWRLLKRMQAMGIVDITKSRRQNTVSIRKKYLKK